MKPFAVFAALFLAVSALSAQRPTNAPDTAPGGPPPDTVMLEDLTWAEVRDLVKGGWTNVIIGTAGTEQKGPHMVDGEHKFVMAYTADKIARGLGRTLTIQPVIAPFRAQLRGQREWLSGLLVAAQLHQRTAQAEQREVVRRGPLDDRLELRPGALVLRRAEVRAAERLADRGLVRREVAGAAQGHRRGVEVPRLQECRAALEEVVDVVRHDDPV